MASRQGIPEAETAVGSVSLHQAILCPVCKDVYEDPCFVCSNHHTLCRKCHQGVAASAAANGLQGKCPECRSPLATNIISNIQMQLLIASAESKPIHGTPCEASEGDGKCTVPALVKCLHCGLSMCGLHFSFHRLKFQSDAMTLAENAEKTVHQAEQQNSKLQEWNKLMVDLIRCLDSEKRRLEELLNSKKQVNDVLATAPVRRNLATMLRTSLESGDLQNAGDVYNQLTSVVSETPHLNDYGEAPTDGQKSNVSSARKAIKSFVNDVIETYQNFSSGSSSPSNELYWLNKRTSSTECYWERVSANVACQVSPRRAAATECFAEKTLSASSFHSPPPCIVDNECWREIKFVESGIRKT